MKKMFFFSAVFYFLINNLFAQSAEEIVPLTKNDVQAQDFINRNNFRIGPSAASISDTIPLSSLGLRDNFSYDSHRPDTTLWYDLTATAPSTFTGVFVNRTW